MSTSSSSKSRPRGRPTLSEQEMAEARRHIADCALRLFQEHGYDAVSMRRLAGEAGCTVMTLYRYFERKIDILRTLWAEVFAELFELLDKVAAGESDPLQRLESVALAYVDFWLRHRERYFLVFMSSGVSQSDVSVFVGDDGLAQRFGLFRTCLSEALGAGCSEKDLALKEQLLLCALHGTAHNLITISAYPWAAPDQLVRAAVSGILKADPAA
ncbi:MAG: TetR/AcrR family transcriptional regulator [Hyphomonas sp.]|uniref:TetR/AcrR family transcriptional regulator n=1 Tax=Hyphomonas sp. TaxID=87 RepID=UPI003528AE9A